MLLYKQIPQFDVNTGKQANPRLVERGFLCDVTGEVIDHRNDEENPLYSISFDYNHDSEPLWYEDAYKFDDEFGIDYSGFGKFMASPYHFSHTEGYGCADVSANLLFEWFKAIDEEDKKSPWIECRTIEQLFSTARLRTLRKLLTEKKYSKLELGFEPENW